jgi:hypothetical protein
MFREISLFLYYFLTGSHQAIKLRTHRDKMLLSSKKRGSQSHCVENKYYYSIDYSRVRNTIKEIGVIGLLCTL